MSDTSRLAIAIASSGLGHIARGIETWADDLASALQRRGESVRLYQGGGTPPAWGEVLANRPRESAENAALRRLFPRPLGWRIGMQASYDVEQTTFAFSLLRALRRQPADILHVQDPLVALRLDQMRRMGLTRTRTILAHGTEEPGGFLQRLRYVQHLSPMQLERWRREGVWRESWTAIGNFVDTDRFQPGNAPDVRAELGIPADAVVILALAAIKRAHKRIDWLIDMVATYRALHPDVPVVLVVAGGREHDTEELIRDGTARLGDSVRFLVRHPRQKIPALCRAADLFVLASLFEMMPIALLEAGASGLPMLTHDEATLRWMTGAGGTPVDMTDVHQVIPVLHRLLTTPTERRALSAAARAHTMETFATDVIVDRIVEYYRSVARGPA
ncbi:MAG TPA: glycosyltransferase family 4 protein [Gemmatimonadales bacterium]|jgi:glycosyltransferase involved in cell wall biosynthesis